MNGLAIGASTIAIGVLTNTIASFIPDTFEVP